MALGKRGRQYHTIGKKDRKKVLCLLSWLILDSTIKKSFFNLSWKARILIWTYNKLHTSLAWNTDGIPQRVLRKHCRSKHCCNPLVKLLPDNPRMKVNRFWSLCYHSGQQKKMKEESPVWTNRKQRNCFTTGRKSTLSKEEGKKYMFLVSLSNQVNKIIQKLPYNSL